jgi:hypothetical protein
MSSASRGTGEVDAGMRAKVFWPDVRPQRAAATVVAAVAERSLIRPARALRAGRGASMPLDKSGDTMYYDEESGALNFVAGMLLGAVIGASLALLTAPQSGRKTPQAARSVRCPARVRMRWTGGMTCRTRYRTRNAPARSGSGSSGGRPARLCRGGRRRGGSGAGAAQAAFPGAASSWSATGSRTSTSGMRPPTIVVTCAGRPAASWRRWTR